MGLSTATAQKLIDAKPAECEHLYIDMDGDLRDRHIEALFEDLFFGRELDDVFQHNFTLYFEHLAQRLIPNWLPISPMVFTDEAVARAWVTTNFGLLHVGEIKADDGPFSNDPDLSHCVYEARLRTRLAVNNDEYVYAPTRLNVVLLSVVQVYRVMASYYHEDMVNRLGI